MAEILRLNFTRINRVLGEDIENIFPHRYHPLAPILAAALMCLTALVWALHKHRNIICTKFSSYHILCYKFCTWKGGRREPDWPDCGFDSDWGRTRRQNNVGVSVVTRADPGTDVSTLAGVLGRLQNTKEPPVTPPPPYEPPPSYSIAVIMAEHEAYIVSEPVLV